MMSEETKLACVSRRTVLIGAAGAVPLLALGATGAQAKIAQSSVRYQDSPKDGKECRRLQALRRAERVQERRWNHFAEGMVHAVGQEGLMTIQLGTSRADQL